MKIKYLFLACLFPFLGQGQVVKNYKQLENGINVHLVEGTLNISPLSENTVRIKFYKDVEAKIPELIFTSNYKAPTFKVADSPTKLELKGEKNSCYYRQTNREVNFCR